MTGAGTRGPVPRWADRAAQATMWCALPSGIWRILFGLGLPAGFTGSQDPANGPWFVLPFVIALTALSEAMGAQFDRIQQEALDLATQFASA